MLGNRWHKPKGLQRENFWMLRALLLDPKLGSSGVLIGGWSIGAPLYVMLNLLLDRHDDLSVIEFGSGQSSRFIREVAEHHPSKVKQHVVVEHDAVFAQHLVERGVDVRIVPLTEKHGGCRYDVNAESLLSEHPFNVFIIDGPFGSRRLSRNNIFDFIDANLIPEDFLIIIDDIHRVGERETEMMVMKELRKAGHQPIRRRYRGLKMCTVIASKSGSFSHLCGYAAHG